MSRPKHSLMSTVRRELPQRKKLLIAVSGGADSVALLNACSQLKSERDLTIGVGHFNHKLRVASDSDAAFVRSLAESLNLPFFIGEPVATPPDVNIESWARDERYGFLEETREQEAYDFILTAHNANDVAETFLMRILSNKEPHTIMRLDHQRKLIRPLLSITREEIDRYIEQNNLKYVVDSSNNDPKFLRNRVRNNLIPVLDREYGPRIVDSLRERAEASSEDLQYIHSEAERRNRELSEFSFGSREWMRGVRALLFGLDYGLQWAVVERAFLPKLGFNLGRSHGRRVVEFLLSNAPKCQIPSGVTLLRSEGGLVFVREGSVEPLAPPNT